MVSRCEEETREWEDWLAKHPKKKKKRKKKPSFNPYSNQPRCCRTAAMDILKVCKMLDEAARGYGIPVDLPGGIQGLSNQLRGVIMKYRSMQRHRLLTKKPLIQLPDDHWIPPIREARMAGQYKPL